MKITAHIKSKVPWWLRIIIKIILARLPVPYNLWKTLRLFEHGDMNKPERAYEIFLEHACAVELIVLDAALPRIISGRDNFTVLELGPGDSLFTAIISNVLGASQTWMVDARPFAAKNMNNYLRLFDFLNMKGYTAATKNFDCELTDILKQCDAYYLTDGIKSLEQLSNDSVDFCFSNAVLEHIPRDDFEKMVFELKRVLKRDGVCHHRVDLKDHLGGGLNNLRFSESIWESSLFRNSGFYTNRIRFGKIINIFDAAGFECSLPRISRWVNLPIGASVLHSSFSGFSTDDLLVNGFDLVLKHKKVID